MEENKNIYNYWVSLKPLKYNIKDDDCLDFPARCMQEDYVKDTYKKRGSILHKDFRPEIFTKTLQKNFSIVRVRHIYIALGVLAVGGYLAYKKYKK